MQPAQGFRWPGHCGALACKPAAAGAPNPPLRGELAQWRHGRVKQAKNGHGPRRRRRAARLPRLPSHRPANGTPVYADKGIGDRCLALHEARRTTTTTDTSGDYPKLAAIRASEDAGQEDRIDPLRHGLTEPKEYAVEAAAIDPLGLTDLRNRAIGSGTSTVGRMSLGDITARYAAHLSRPSTARPCPHTRVPRQ
jgi:hypothetical protein